MCYSDLWNWNALLKNLRNIPSEFTQIKKKKRVSIPGETCLIIHWETTIRNSQSQKINKRTLIYPFVQFTSAYGFFFQCEYLYCFRHIEYIYSVCWKFKYPIHIRALVLSRSLTTWILLAAYSCATRNTVKLKRIYTKEKELCNH